jgi:hypothetical protein
MARLLPTTYLKYLLFALLLLAPILSVSTWTNPDKSDADYIRKDATGMKAKEASSFLYFYDVLGLFPLASVNNEVKKIGANSGAAKKFIRENPDKLRMEMGHWYRFGEHARIFTLLPSYYLNDDHTIQATVKPFNVIFFTVTLLILGLALFKQFGVVVAIVGVTLVSSSQFLTAEALLRENIFAIHPLLHMLAISSYLLVAKSTIINKVIVSIGLSILIGLTSEIRGENLTAIAVSLFFWLFISGENIKRNTLMIILCIATVISTKGVIRLYFENLHEKTVHVVIENKGVPFQGGVTDKHPIWHPLLAGLGDYGSDKGFLWSDRNTFLLVQKNSPLKRDYLRKREFYDPDTQYYYKRYETKEGYSQYAKELYLNTIIENPLWFSKILIRRVYTVLTEIPPIKVNLYFYSFELNRYMLAGLILISMLLFYKRRSWHTPTRVEYFIILAALSMSANAILIHSGRGITYAATYQYWIVILLLSRLVAPKHQSPTALQKEL